MTATVIEAGPVLVRGPGAVPAELSQIAVECIDDALALIDDEPMPVDELWVQVVRTAAGGHADRPIVVCPTWWTTDRVDRVRAAAADIDGVVLRRAQAFAAGLQDLSWAVVEIADELVMVSRGDGESVRLVRRGVLATLADQVADATRGAAEVIIDAPPEVGGSDGLGKAIAGAVRCCGATVSTAESQMLGRCARDAVARDEVTASSAPTGSRGNRRAVGAGLVMVIACVAIAARPGTEPEQRVLVEGRVGMQVPADWSVRRITGGPGSARVEVVSADDPITVIHLTQSPANSGDSRAVAATLRRALDEQSPGVFVDFNPADRIAERPVASYREVRGGREIRWVVLVDHTVRIAIGCQGVAGRDLFPECEAAIRSAHAVH
ncbi:type VII secretion-associated protein [Mycobacterium sp. 155]|uniref:type VII secretion-associated protein n=1 Tax=Mycobacterium sp. 155 TaxID=1157943 RepID=UPI000369B4D8|nr:type VII secretion-associated protein [Mycobacterium sp. 155]